MRRKSTRNAQKSPEKTTKEDSPAKVTRRSKRRKRSPSKSSDSEDEILTVTRRAPVEETPDTTTKSHTPSDDETSQEPVWKVTSTEETPKGEIQKLKICLTRPSPDSPEKSKSRRSKSGSHTEDDATSSEDKSSSSARKTRSSRGSPFVRNDGISSQEEDVEEKKGKGKSKSKHKSKIEKPANLNEPEIQPNNEISENAQVTPQSPSIDKPVDNENDYTKVEPDDTKNDIEKEGHCFEDDNSCKNDDNNASNKPQPDSDSDNEPLSVIKQVNNTEDGDAQNEQLIVETVAETVIADRTLEPETESTTVETPPPLQVKATEEEEEVSNIVTERESSSDKEEIESKKVSEPVTEQLETVNTKDEVEPEDVEMTDLIPRQDPEEHEISQPVKETGEETSLKEAEVETETVKTPRKRLNRDTELPKIDTNDDKDTSEDQEKPQSERVKPSKIIRKWNVSSVTSSLVKIDLETIQTAFPTIEFPEEPDLKVEAPKERRKSVAESKKIERKVSIEYASDTSEKPSYEKQVSAESGTEDSEDKSNIIAFNRKISIVDDTASKLRPPPSPAKNPTSEVLYITNLVRPFTLKQLKELLERTGNIVEEGFWTDRIKSKCYVQYKSVEEAEATRNALHGVQWPIGNGKNLIIDYATVDDLEKAKNPPTPPPPPTAAPEIKASAKENVEPPDSKSKLDEKSSREAERKKRSDGPIREWDIGKKNFHHDRSRSRSRSRDRSRKHRRTVSPPDDFISRKQRKAEESAPQKLMDDLFLKTKTTPSIYWQPLSPEEIAMKQQQRLLRMEEHKRRMEESSRMKMRDAGRGGFRRRYD